MTSDPTDYVPLEDFVQQQLRLRPGGTSSSPLRRSEPEPPQPLVAPQPQAQQPQPQRRPEPEPEPVEEDEQEEAEEGEEAHDEPERSGGKRGRRRRRRRAGGTALDTSQIDGSSVDALWTLMLRGSAWGMWLITFSGSIISMHGGWVAFVATIRELWALPISLEAKAVFLLLMWQTWVGLGLQAIITLTQLRFRRRKFSLVYGGTSLVSTGTTWFGFRDVLVPFWQAVLATVSVVGWLSWLIGELLTVAVSFLTDYLPEKVLIRN